MTSRQEIPQRLCVHLARLAPDQASVDSDVDLVQDYGLDSVGVRDVLMEIEDELDVSISLDVVAERRTPAQLARAIGDLLEATDGAVR